MKKRKMWNQAQMKIGAIWLDVYVSQAPFTIRGKRPRVTSGRLVARITDPSLIQPALEGLFKNLLLESSDDELLAQEFKPCYQSSMTALEAAIRARSSLFSLYRSAGDEFLDSENEAAIGEE